MSNMIECGTCGYPLLPEERRSLVESNGKMVKPWVGLTDDEIGEIKQTSPIYVSAKAVNAIVPMVEAKLKEKNA